jgi:hypothetical protein
MLIQEAIKSGARAIRRKSSTSIDGRWILILQYCFAMEDNFETGEAVEYPSFSPEDILADNWEIKQ